MTHSLQLVRVDQKSGDWFPLNAGTPKSLADAQNKADNLESEVRHGPADDLFGVLLIKDGESEVVYTSPRSQN